MLVDADDDQYVKYAEDDLVQSGDRVQGEFGDDGDGDRGARG